MMLQGNVRRKRMHRTLTNSLHVQIWIPSDLDPVCLLRIPEISLLAGAALGADPPAQL